jgi:hypothetical protein
VIVMPVTSTDPSVLTRDGMQSKFSKKGEKAAPGSYEVTLAKWNVKAELTASTHVGHHRYTFPDGVTPQVVLDLSRGLGNTDVSEQTSSEVDATTIRGSMLVKGQFSEGFGGNRVFFEVRTNRAYSVTQRSADGHVLELGFAPGAPVELLVGLSLVSQAGATANLNAEAGDGFVFDAHRDAAAQAWRDRLSRARVFGGSEEDRATFYSALRLPFLMPTTISDVDGAYVYGGMPGQVGAGEVMLSDFSLWDTYRTVHPLYALLSQDSARWSVQSLLRMAANGRGLPRWPQATGEAGTMVGAPADIVFADAVLRGVPGIDGEALWQEASNEAIAARGSRAAMGQYATLGYVPLEESGRSVGITVEYAHADFALANLGRALGHVNEAAVFDGRAKGWRKLFDPAHKVLRPRDVSGALVTLAYTLESWDGYAEANALQTTFMPTWDLDGMDALFGSREAFLTEFEAFFDAAPAENAAAIANPTFELRWLERYHYWPSNEPDIHTPFALAVLHRRRCSDAIEPPSDDHHRRADLRHVGAQIDLLVGREEAAGVHHLHQLQRRAAAHRRRSVHHQLPPHLGVGRPGHVEEALERPVVDHALKRSGQARAEITGDHPPLGDHRPHGLHEGLHRAAQVESRRTAERRGGVNALPALRQVRVEHHAAHRVTCVVDRLGVADRLHVGDRRGEIVLPVVVEHDRPFAAVALVDRVALTRAAQRQGPRVAPVLREPTRHRDLLEIHVPLVRGDAVHQQDRRPLRWPPREVARERQRPTVVGLRAMHLRAGVHREVRTPCEQNDEEERGPHRRNSSISVKT